MTEQRLLDDDLAFRIRIKSPVCYVSDAGNNNNKKNNNSEPNNQTIPLIIHRDRPCTTSVIYGVMLNDGLRPETTPRL